MLKILKHPLAQLIIMPWPLGVLDRQQLVERYAVEPNVLQDLQLWGSQHANEGSSEEWVGKPKESKGTKNKAKTIST